MLVSRLWRRTSTAPISGSVKSCARPLTHLLIGTQVRPVSKRSKTGYLQVGVETYGGGLWHTWFDRDLSLAGRVVIADKSGNFQAKLVKIDKPLLRVPSLAIHCEPIFPFFPAPA